MPAPPAPRAASDYQIVVGQLADVPRASAEDLLTLAPGVFLANHGGRGHASSVFLRGFDAGEGQDIEMTLEGVPLNSPSHAHGHGFADTNFIISGLVDRLRVVEGPYDPRQGDFAVAGTAEYSLGLEQRGVVTRAGVGTYGLAELTALWGPRGMGRDTFVGVELSRGDGWGVNRAHQAVRAMAQVGFDLSEETRVTVLATSYATRFDSAGVVRMDDVTARRVAGCADDFTSQFFCTYDENQGGANQRHGLSARLERTTELDTVRASSFATLGSSRFRENFTGFELDPRTDGSPQRGDGLEQTHEAVQVGARASYSRAFDALERRHDAEVGLSFRHDRGSARMRRLRTADGVPYATDFDNAFGITNAGLYGAGRFTPWSWLVLRGGLRLDSYVFAIEDHDEPEVDRTGSRLPSTNREAFGFAVQPRGSLTFVLAPWMWWATSVGLGSRSSDAQALSDGESAPFAEVVSVESGVTLRRTDGHGLQAETRLVAFATRVTNDLVFDERAGRNTPIGVSNRFGASLWGRITHALSGIDLAAALTYADAYLPPEDASPLDLAAGLRLPYVPRWVLRLDGSERRTFDIGSARLRASLGIGLSFVDRRPLPFEQFGAAVGEVDVGATVGWRMADIGVELTNLFDRRNREMELNYPSNFGDPSSPGSRLPARHWIAGAPFQAMGTLTLHLDEEALQP